MTFAAYVFLIAFLVTALLLVCVLIAFHDRMNELERRLPPRPTRLDLPRRGIR